MLDVESQKRFVYVTSVQEWMDADESIVFMNSERQRFFLFLLSWDNLKVCNERRHSIAILECIPEIETLLETSL